MLLDTHYHLDFLPAKAQLAFLDELDRLDVQIVAQTLVPSSFQPLHQQCGTRTRTAVGFHPWYLHDVDHELAIFAEGLQLTRFVGEIGLDFSDRRRAEVPEQLQLHVLRELLASTIDAAQHSPEPYVLSLHAVRSASTLLDLLTESRSIAQNVVPIIHWFSGTSDDLTRLMRLGGYLSVNPQMLASKRGRAYVQQIPLERILLESDLPNEPATDIDPATAAAGLAASLTSTFCTLVELRGDAAHEAISQTQRILFGSCDDGSAVATPPAQPEN